MRVRQEARRLLSLLSLRTKLWALLWSLVTLGVWLLWRDGAYGGFGVGVLVLFPVLFVISLLLGQRYL